MEAARQAWNGRGGLLSVFGGNSHCRSEGQNLAKAAPPGALTRLNSLQVPVSPGAFTEICVGALERWRQLSSDEKAAQVESLAFFTSRGLRWHVASLDAALSSCALLQALATASLQCADAVVASGAPLVMLDAAKAHSVHWTLHTSFCVVCGTLRKNKSRHLALELAAEGAFAIITNLMRTFPLDVVVQQAGCGALAVIGSSTATHAVALSSGAVHTALFSLRDPLLAVELRAAAASALCPFCESPATARAMLEAGVLDGCLQLIQKHSAARAAAALLAALIENEPLSWRPAVKKGAVQRLAAAARGSQEAAAWGAEAADVDVCCAALATLLSVDDDDCCPGALPPADAATCGACEMVVQCAMPRAAESPSLALSACTVVHGVLYALNADYKSGAQTLDRCGGAPAVCSALCAVVRASCAPAPPDAPALPRLRSAEAACRAAQLLCVYALGIGAAATAGVLGPSLAAAADAMEAHADSADIREAGCELLRVAARVDAARLPQEHAAAAARAALHVARGLRGPLSADERTQAMSLAALRGGLESANPSARAGAEAATASPGALLGCAEALQRFPSNHKLQMDGFRLLLLSLERGAGSALRAAALAASAEGSVRETALALMSRCWEPGVDFHPGSAPAAASAVVRMLKAIEKGEEEPAPSSSRAPPPAPRRPSAAEEDPEEWERRVLEEWATTELPALLEPPAPAAAGPATLSRLAGGRSHRRSSLRMIRSDSGFDILAGPADCGGGGNPTASAAAAGSKQAQQEQRQRRSSEGPAPPRGPLAPVSGATPNGSTDVSASGTAGACGSQAETGAPLLQELMRDEILSLRGPPLLPSATSGPGPLSEAEAAAAWRDHRPRRETAPHASVKGPLFAFDTTRGRSGPSASPAAAAAHAAATLPPHVLAASSGGSFDLGGPAAAPMPRLGTPAQAASLFDNLDLSNLMQVAEAAELFETLEYEQDDTAEAAALVGNPLPGGRRSPGQASSDDGEPPEPVGLGEAAAPLWVASGGSPRGEHHHHQQQQQQQREASGTGAAAGAGVRGPSATAAEDPLALQPAASPSAQPPAGPIAPPDPFGVAASWLGLPQVAPNEIRSHPSVTAIWDAPSEAAAPRGAGPPAAAAALRNGLSVGGGLHHGAVLPPLSQPYSFPPPQGSDGVSASRSPDGLPLRKAATLADLSGGALLRSSIGSDSSGPDSAGFLWESGGGAAPWRAAAGAPQWRALGRAGAGGRGRGALPRSATTACIAQGFPPLWCDGLEGDLWPVRTWEPRESDGGAAADGEHQGGGRAAGGRSSTGDPPPAAPLLQAVAGVRRRSLALETVRSSPAGGGGAGGGGAGAAAVSGGVWAAAMMSAVLAAPAGGSGKIEGAGA